MITITPDIDLLRQHGKMEQAQIGKTADWSEQVKYLARNGDHVTGEKLPWHKTHEKIGLREKELTIWAGINSAGKSALLGQVLLFFPPDVKCMIASLEMPPEQTIYRMAKQSIGQELITDTYVDHFNSLTENIYIYDQLDTVQPETMIGLIHFAAQEYGIKHFMIDSLVKCGISPEDYPSQKTFIDRLTWAARSENIHIHLVHHIRKTDNAKARPDKFSVKGAGEITDLADNVALLWRNFDKEQRAQSEHVDPMEPDLCLIWDKQRHFSWTGDINLYWHPSGQLRGGPDSNNLKWRIETRYPEAQ